MHFDTQKSIPRSRLKYSVLAAHNQKKKKKIKSMTHANIVLSITFRKGGKKKEQPSKTKIHLTQNPMSYTA